MDKLTEQLNDLLWDIRSEYQALEDATEPWQQQVCLDNLRQLWAEHSAVGIQPCASGPRCFGGPVLIVDGQFTLVDIPGIPEPGSHICKQCRLMEEWARA